MPRLTARSVKDLSLRRALHQALRGDGSLSYSDVKALLASTLDGDGVTRHEYEDLKTILRDSKTIDLRSRKLVGEFLKKQYKPVIKTPASGQLTTNFKLSEFACKDGTPVPSNLMSNVQALATNLQVLRDAIKKPIKINSSYRTPTHNKSVGGASNSQHLYAKAADIVVKGMAPALVRKKIESLISSKKMSQGGIGRYNTFVHYDIRGTKARW